MKLSIVIPTFNEEKYLRNLLLEIKKQDFKDYEIIVSDAGSDDKTTEIAKEFGCILTYGGLPSKGRNEGAKLAQGEYILFVDSDVIFLPDNFLKKALNEFDKMKLSVAGFVIFTNGNNFDFLAYWIYNKFIWLVQRFLPYASNVILVKKDIHQKIKGFDENVQIAEDYEYVRRAAKFGKFRIIKTKPILISARRFERDGRLKTYSKLILYWLWFEIIGPIRSDIFHYQIQKRFK